jgi:dGTPase
MAKQHALEEVLRIVLVLFRRRIYGLRGCIRLSGRRGKMNGCNFDKEVGLSRLKEMLDLREEEILSRLAAKSRAAVRRHPETKSGHRQAYSIDGDRVLHSRAYTRYIDKTQVFYMVDNDHITHRVLHVQLVSKIARTVGRFLGLNEDLIEAVALGHDIGHPPFGHDGETMLDSLCRQHGLPSFQHNLQSIRFLDHIERKGRGWNLSLQVLDGILCHDGEIHNESLSPRRDKDFVAFDSDVAQKMHDSSLELVPMTLEGCVVRFADTIAYIGRDIEDAIELRLVTRNDIPRRCLETLGSTNGSIVYSLVADLIDNGTDGDRLAFSREISDALIELKRFNYSRIYTNPAIKNGLEAITLCYRALFENYLEAITKNQGGSSIFTEFLGGMDETYLEKTASVQKVCDFIAGMTDDYFLSQAEMLGCEVPAR